VLSLKTWRTVAAALLLVALATTATATAAGTTTPAHPQAHYCKQVDAYRLKTCAKALLPDSPLGRQLGWVLAQLAGRAATLTEAEVRAHFSAAFLTVVIPPEGVIGALQGTIAEIGTIRFVGLPTRHGARQAVALVQSTSGVRGAVEIGVTSGRPSRIEFLEVQGAGPTIVPKGRFSGWFDIGGRRLFLRCTGHRGPTVVFEGGLTTDWYELQNQLSGFTRVCSYDRPGGRTDTTRFGPVELLLLDSA
jgi:ORF 12 gene product N-terminal